MSSTSYCTKPYNIILARMTTAIMLVTHHCGHLRRDRIVRRDRRAEWQRGRGAEGQKARGAEGQTHIVTQSSNCSIQAFSKKIKIN